MHTLSAHPEQNPSAQRLFVADEAVLAAEITPFANSCRTPKPEVSPGHPPRVNAAGRLVLADVDGTILRHSADDDQASPRVVKAVKRFLSEGDGNMLVPATSRTAKLMGKVAAQLKLRHLGILDGGATIFDLGQRTMDTRLSRWLDAAKTTEVLGAIAAQCTEVYYGPESLRYKGTKKIEQASPSVFAVHANTEADSILRALAGVTGISIHSNPYEGSTTHSCVQVVSAGVSKHSGVSLLLADPRYAAVAPENIMVIGDGDPDADLLRSVPEGAWRVAMGNSNDYLRQFADDVVPHVDQDGFAEALEQFMSR